ncbi:uncharacterized protein LOC124663124 [Lolium rigidum]|uniref:uncharacterized protein LOC124663124 n=1 Tax=Lolium rigidum TaxID=89674 RepID=UPI001F5D8D50|nr:uncharacterized protein LOC124663124 [Lolium rigidum]
MKNKNGRRWRINLAREKAAAAAAPDRLSDLPNDLLLNILERVDTVDAVKTCILSKQLLKLPAMLSQLYVSISSFSTSSPGSVIRANRAVARVTDNILSTRSPEITIRRLKIRFVLKLHDSRSIAKSVVDAMATQKIHSAELEIITDKAFKNSSPDDLVQSGRQFNTFLGACPDAFACLTRLWLRNMRFGELDIPNILTTCKCLEALRLSNCDSGVISVLRVEHDQLVELHIDYGDFERVELIFLPKLQRVSYVFNNWASSSYKDPMYFGIAPQLSKLSLTRTGIHLDKPLELSQLLANVPSIDDLHLDFRSEKIWVLPECRELLMPVLSKLLYLSLDNLPEGCDIAWTMFILEGAPSLKELCIMVRDHWCIMATDKEYRRANGYCEKEEVKWKSLASDFKHRNLVKLTIYGFQPDDNFVRYIRRVVEVAVKLLEISLHDRNVCGKDCADLNPEINVCPSRYPRTAEERKQTTKALSLASRAKVHFWS